MNHEDIIAAIDHRTKLLRKIEKIQSDRDFSVGPLIQALHEMKAEFDESAKPLIEEADQLAERIKQWMIATENKTIHGHDDVASLRFGCKYKMENKSNVPRAFLAMDTKSVRDYVSQRWKEEKKIAQIDGIKITYAPSLVQKRRS